MPDPVKIYAACRIRTEAWRRCRIAWVELDFQRDLYDVAVEADPQEGEVRLRHYRITGKELCS